jgi:hypothetical protein
MDTHSFKAELNKILASLNISPKKVEQLVNQKFIKERLPSFIYSPEFVGNTLLKAGLVDSEKKRLLLGKINTSLKESFRFLPESSIKFILELKNEFKIEPIILSFGDQKFQENKIKNSKLLEKIGPLETHIIQENKANYLAKKIIPQKGNQKILYFINDKKAENKEVEEKTNIKTILKLPFYKEGKTKKLKTATRLEGQGYTWKEILAKLKQSLS